MPFLTQDRSGQLPRNDLMNIDMFSTPGGFESWPHTEDPISKHSEDPPALIAVMGVTGSGKTTFVNQASGSYLKVGEDLESCTSETQESEEFTLDGRRVVLIDTPGFDDTHTSDADVLKSIATFLGESYSAGAKLAGVIYIHRISDDKFGGLAAKNFRMFRQLCGEKTLKNVVLVTNMWGRVTSRKGEAREQQLMGKYFKAAIEKGAQLCRHNNTPESAREILRKILQNQPAVLKIQRELIDEGKDIGQTGAGAELNREMREAVERYQRKIKELEESVRRAMNERDEELRELREEKRRMQQEMEKLRRDCEGMRLKFEEARREMDKRIDARVEEQMARYNAEIREYRAKVKELECDRDENASEIRALKEKTEKLQREMEGRWKCAIM